jgi:DNA-binding transcriptional MerR regulator
MRPAEPFSRLFFFSLLCYDARRMLKKQTENQRILKRIKQWKNAHFTLEKIRRQAIEESDTPKAIIELEDAFQSALLHYSPSDTSGLVELERFLMRLR